MTVEINTPPVSEKEINLLAKIFAEVLQEKEKTRRTQEGDKNTC